MLRCTAGEAARLSGVGTDATRERIQRGTSKTVFKDDTVTSWTSARHVTSVDNGHDAESIVALSVTLMLTLRQVKNPL